MRIKTGINFLLFAILCTTAFTLEFEDVSVWSEKNIDPMFFYDSTNKACLMGNMLFLTRNAEDKGSFYDYLTPVRIRTVIEKNLLTLSDSDGRYLGWISGDGLVLWDVAEHFCLPEYSKIKTAHFFRLESDSAAQPVLSDYGAESTDSRHISMDVMSKEIRRRQPWTFQQTVNLIDGEFLIFRPDNQGTYVYSLELDFDENILVSYEKRRIELGYAQPLLNGYIIGSTENILGFHNPDEVIISMPVISDYEGRLIKSFDNIRLFSYRLPERSGRNGFLVSPDRRKIVFVYPSTINGNIDLNTAVIHVVRVLYGDETGQTATVLRENQLFAEPDLTSHEILILKKNDRVNIIEFGNSIQWGDKLQTIWYKIDFKGTVGWVMGKDIDY